MNRIRRLFGLQTVPTKRLGGWLAPAAAMLAVAVTLSAVAMARPVEGKRPKPAHPEIVFEAQDSDVVSVLESMDAKEAALFRTLRDAGLNDRMLVMVLEAMEPEPEVLKAVQAANMRRGVARRLRNFHERIEADLEAGRITEQEAQERIERMERGIHERMAAGRMDGRRPRGDHARMKHDPERAHKRIQEALDAGEITEEEAKERLERMKTRRLRAVAEREMQQAIARRIAEHMETIHAEIEEALANGEITEEEAQARLEQVKQRIHERLGRMHGRRGHVPEEVMQRMKAIHDEIRAQLEAGEITEAEARQRLQQARQALHEEFMSQQGDEPRRERRRPDTRRRRGARDKADEPVLDL
jgi:hypothetical protein